MAILKSLLGVFLLLIITVEAYVDPNLCAPCMCGGKECPGMDWTCQNGGEAAGVAECGESNIQCLTNDIPDMFQMNPESYCTCHNNTFGNCKLQNTHIVLFFENTS